MEHMGSLTVEGFIWIICMIWETELTLTNNKPINKEDYQNNLHKFGENFDFRWTEPLHNQVKWDLAVYLKTPYNFPQNPTIPLNPLEIPWPLIHKMCVKL